MKPRGFGAGPDQKGKMEKLYDCPPSKKSIDFQSAMGKTLEKAPKKKKRSRPRSETLEDQTGRGQNSPTDLCLAVVAFLLFFSVG